MNSKLLILTVLFSLPFICSAQGKFKKKYQDQLEPNSKLIDAGYHFTFEKMKNRSIIYKIYFPDTKQITHFMTFKDEKTMLPHGKYQEWYDNGKLWKSGTYTKGIKTGNWLEVVNYNHMWYESGNYDDGKRTGEWVTKDTLEQVRSRYNYLDGELDGLYQKYDSLGNLVKELMYKNGEVIDTVQNDGEVFEVVEVLPSFKGCDPDLEEAEYKSCSERRMLEYIYSKVKYPRIARENGVQGTAIISFIVGKDGTVEDVQVLRGICEEIRVQCRDLVEAMPDWNPGLQNGEAVRVHFNLPVKFRLE